MDAVRFVSSGVKGCRHVLLVALAGHAGADRPAASVLDTAARYKWWMST